MPYVIMDGLEFGLSLMNARRRREMSQKDAARKMKMTQATLSQIERGRILPNLKMQEKLKKLFPEVFDGARVAGTGETKVW